MKLWEILPQLQPGQKFKITYKDGDQAELEWNGDYMRHVSVTAALSINRLILEADYEIIPQSVPFEEAFAELRKGKTICYEYAAPFKRTEIIEITPEPAERAYEITIDTMLRGKWWVK